jgi:phosphoribosylformylglycinamidine cyclo-ligase
VHIKRGSWPVLPIFELMQRIGAIEDAEMYRTFNMGVGMIVVCAPTDLAQITSQARARESNCFEIGRVIEGPRKVVIA